MKLSFIFILLLLMVITLASCEGVNPEKIEKTVIESIVPPQVIPSIPIITPVYPEPSIDYSRFESPFGYASLGMTSRDLVSGYRVVNNEYEFLEALLNNDIQTIEIAKDLNMGSNYVESLLSLQGKTLDLYRSVYRRHSNAPILHPTLIEHGVGLIRLVLKNKLTIFSNNGSTVSHASFLIDGSNDLTIRNLELNGLWEWDEEDRGQYKRNDWDYFTIEKSSNIWIDHITFNQAYDGIIDIKGNTENITLSWSKLNFRPNQFIEDQINYLEENRESNPFYDELRTSGVSVEDIILHSSFQKKGFNLGNTTNGSGFESITMTFHHLEIYNLQDRMPRLRKGDVHVYHIIMDNQELHDQRLKLSSSALSYINQGIVTTEDGAVLMENSVFKYVSNPIRNHQDSRPDEKYTGRYRVINSEMISNNRIYFGSSEDLNSRWVHDNQANKLSFRLRNHINIPYQYTLSDIYYLPEIFSVYPVGNVVLLGFDWLNINLNV